MTKVTSPILLDSTGQTMAGYLQTIAQQGPGICAAAAAAATSAAAAANAAAERIEAIDLSFVDVQGKGIGLRSTANTYIVRTAGTYRLPLVYGNGIKNGNVNSAAYTSGGGTYQAAFVNHLGNPILSPYIEQNAGCGAGQVGLLWQTASGMISDIHLMQGPDCRYITFNVNSVPATNGLAVLYVKDSGGNIMWSWTIWVTTDNLTVETITNYTEVTYDMLPEALCAIWNSDRTKYVAPHYQWGRKDPMCPPAAYNSNSNMTLYDVEGNVYSGFGALGSDCDQSADKTVANAIKHPELFFTRYNDTYHNWNNLAWFNNFWNAALNVDSDLADNQASAVKTVYDPCPVGFMMPAGRFATGFTTTGSNTSTAGEFNVVGSFDAGWKFKKNSSDAVGTFYPAAGYRGYGSGGLDRVGGTGYFWTFAPYSQTGARNLRFDSGYVYPLISSYRSYGFSVRPSRELN